MTHVTVVIVSFNTCSELVQCVREASAVVDVDVIVIDNASSDGSADAVTTQFPGVRVIRNPENVGFARAVNQGLLAGEGPYFLLLNSDTSDLEQAIPKLAAYLDAHPDAGIVAPQLRHLDGRLQPSGRDVPSRWDEAFWTLSLYRLVGKKGPDRFFDPNRDYDETRDVEEVSGACFMTRREVIDRVGMLDERFFFCFEDIDFCIRVRAGGFRVVYLADAKLTHAWGVSAKKAGPSLSRKYLAGYFYYLRKTHGAVFALVMRVLVALKALLTLPVAIVRKGTLRTALDTLRICAGFRP